jgi:large subunit ribosomal protein L15
MTKQLNLSNLQPAQERKDRKRIGRGLGSGKGRYSGRGIKGQKSRAGSHKLRAGFEGGQMPLYMRVGKERGSTSKDAMPIGPFRTYSQPVNVASLERFDAGTEVTPELLKEVGLIRTVRKDVKILGNGDLKTKLTVVAHAVSAAAREKIEGAGGTVSLLREPKVKKAPKKRVVKAEEPEETTEENAPAEPEAEAEASEGEA